MVLGLAVLLTLATTPIQRVNDDAQVMTKEQVARITSSLERYEVMTTDQVVVMTIRQLPTGETIEAFALRRFNELGIGQKKVNNGVLIVLATEPRQIRITVGYGIEKRMPDGVCSALIRAATPRLRQHIGDGIEELTYFVVGYLDAHR